MCEQIYAIDNTTKEIAAKERIVRCRDCKHCGQGIWGQERFPTCERPTHAFTVTDDGFCAWGEPKKERK